MSKAISVNITHLPAGKYTSQRDLDLRRRRLPKYVDQERSHLNRTLIEPPPASVMRQRMLECRHQLGRQPDARHEPAIACVALIGFGKTAQRLVEAAAREVQDELYRKVAMSLAEHWEVELLGLVVHADEARPHAHAVIDSWNRHGPLRKGRMLKGVWVITSSAAASVIPEFTRGQKKIRTPPGEPGAVHDARRAVEPEEMAVAGVIELVPAAGKPGGRRSRKPISEQLKLALAQQRESARRVRKLRQAQAENDRELLAEYGHVVLTRLAGGTAEQVAECRRKFLNPGSPHAILHDEQKLHRLGELLDEEISAAPAAPPAEAATPPPAGETAGQPGEAEAEYCDGGWLDHAFPPY